MSATRSGRALSRRGLLIGGGMVAAWGAAGCSNGSPSITPTPSTTETTSPEGDQPTGDLAFAGLAASVENLLTATYQTALGAAGDGKLGTVPSSLSTLLRTLASHHRDHAAAWNAILTAAGLSAVTGVDETLQTSVAQPALASLRSATGLAELATGLERIAAATYLQAAQGGLTTTGAVQTAIAIQPVEMQHLAVLQLFVTSAPFAGSFASTSGARTVRDSVA
jgi:Ferritin-like domain